MLTGDNSILKRAGEASVETRGSTVEEQARLWEAEKVMYENTGKTGKAPETVEQIVNRLVSEKVLTPDERDQILGNEDKGIEATGQITIGGRTIVFGKAGGNDDIPIGQDFTDKNNNEWVWIEVPKTIYTTTGTGKTTFTLADLKNIRTDLLKYTGTLMPDGEDVTTTRNGGKDFWYDWDAENWQITVSVDPLFTSEELAAMNISNDVLNSEAGCGLTYANYKAKYEAMLESVYTNGGFYIGKYETGYKFAEGETEVLRTAEGATTQKPVIQQDAYPYNYVTLPQAQKLAEGNDIAISGKTTSLMFGVQWDLVLKYLNVKGNLTVADLTQDSTKWGNYSNNQSSETASEDTSFKITSEGAKASDNYGESYDSIAENTVKTDTKLLLTTGSSSDLAPLNIYDLAGNLYEWTLEYTSFTRNPCSQRGGSFGYDGSRRPASNRDFLNPTDSILALGFRVSLY